MTPALELRGVTLTHAEAPRPVLREVDLTVREGDLAVVAGRTGAGKSTLLGLLNGRRIPAEWANKWYLNVALGITTLIFLVLGVNQLWGAVADILG